MFAGGPSYGPRNPKEGDAAEDEVAPLDNNEISYSCVLRWRGGKEGSTAYFISGLDQGADQASDNHDFVNEDGVQDCRPRDACC